MQGRRGDLENKAPRCFLVLLTILLASCGGGGGDGGGGGGGLSDTPASKPPTGLSYPAPPEFIVNRSIAPLAPTVSGQVASYSVTPELPAGVLLNSSTGVISGTPTVSAARASYTIMATNASGNAFASVSIVVDDAVAPIIQYASSQFAFSTDVAGTVPAPTRSGEAVVSWTVSPALPAGLQLNQADGSISGTPSAAAAAITYAVTATNPVGQSTVNVTIAVGGPPLLDLGHASTVDVLQLANSRVLSRDSNGHWILQDFASGTTLASGDSPCTPPPTSGACVLAPISLAGNVLIDGTATGLEVRDASDGHLLTTISAQESWWSLASDGSYVCAGSTTGLTAWSPVGQVLLSHAGNYSTATAFAAPGQINVALGAAGQQVIESISLATGTASLTPAFQGQFSLWFSDGARFLTTQGDTVRTYSVAGVQQDITQLSLSPAPPAPSTALAGGLGNWFWTVDGLSKLRLYQVGSSSSATFTASATAYKAFVSGTTIGVIPFARSGQVEVIDLSGATPVSATYPVPLSYPTAYAATSANTWLVANGDGVVLDGTSLASQPRYLTEGIATVVGGTQYFSVATASGKIRFYESSTHNLLGTIDFPSLDLSASSDGTVLAAVASLGGNSSVPGGTVNVYSLPSGSLINSFPPQAYTPAGISLAGSGTVLAEVLSSTATPCGGQAMAITGGVSLWCAPAPVATLQVSPDGSLIATASSQYQTAANTTSIYKNGSLVATVPGTPVGWLDNTRLLAAVFRQVPQNGGGTTDVFQDVAIYDSLGNNQGATSLVDIVTAQPITTDKIYSPDRNAITSLTTGAVSWMSTNSNAGLCFIQTETFGVSTAVCFGALSGAEVIFASGTSVLAQPVD
jgi:hypothetical protein